MNTPQSFLRYILIRVVPPITLVLSLIGGGMYWYIQRTMEDELVERHRNLSTLVVSQITQQFQSITRQGTALAQNDLIINSLMDLETRESHLPNFFNTLKIGDGINALVELADYRGREIATNQAQLTTNLIDRPWIEAVIKQNKAAYRFDYRGWVGILPIRYAENAEGALVISIPPEEFLSLFNLTTISMVALIVDERNNVLFTSNPTLVKSYQVWNPNHKAEWFQSVHSLPGYRDITVITLEKYETAFSLLHTLGVEVGIVIVVLLVGGIAGISRAAVLSAESVNTLTNAVQKIRGSNDLNRRMEISGPQEMQNLAQAFNQMIGVLQVTTTSKGYVEGIIQSLREMLVVTNWEGRIRLVNPAARDCLNRRGLGENDGLHKALGIKPNHTFLSAARGHDTNIEVRLSQPGGQYRQVVWHKTVMTDEESGEISMIFVGHDVTQERMAETELKSAMSRAEEANLAKSQFLANMSHELRTPLNAIIGFSELLIDEAEDTGGSDSQEDLQKIRNSGKHLLQLINDILDISKIEAGKMEILPETFGLEAFVRDVETSAAPLMAKNNNTFEVDLPATSGEMIADETKVRQILLNLLSNAAKFTENGRITLGVKSEQEQIVFTVEDTGIGIPEEKIATLFDSFTQVDASITRKYGGTGLGLSISRKLIHLMNGEISIRSTPGEGTRFTVTLPRQNGHLITRETPESSPEEYPDVAEIRERVEIGDPSSRLVMIIEDDPSSALILARMMVRNGFRAMWVQNSPEGIDLIRARKPVLVALDIIMPGMNGWEILKKLKSDPELSSTPVLICSSLEDEKKGLELGADAYLVKPIDQKRLRETLSPMILI